MKISSATAVSAHRIMDDAFLDGQRRMGDPEADRFIAEVFQDAKQKEALKLWLKNAAGNADLNALALKFSSVNFISSANQLPAWADLKRLRTGSVFFSRHSVMIMSLLGLLSLPYCYNAANGARVLYISEKIKKETTKRLYETAVFVWEMMAPNAFLPDGKAFTEILKVRLIHATVRYYTLKSGQWDDSWGLPINQEDMAGTNLSFSLIVIRGLRLMGFQISRKEQDAFLHLWNVIGYLSGLDRLMIAKDPRMAQQLDRAISRRQFHASEHGRELTRSLTDHILTVNQSKATDPDILGLMRYLLGKEVADQLGIIAPELPAYKLSLLRTINLLKSLRPKGDPERSYYEAYHEFRTNRPA